MIEIINLEWTRILSTKRLKDSEEKLIANKIKKYLLTLSIKADVLYDGEEI